jgi:hypothetical protein
MVGILLALVVAAPMVSAQSQGGKPKDVDEKPINLDSGVVFGNCDFPVWLEYSGKAKTLQLPGERFIFTSPELTAILTNLDTGKQERVVITGAFHQTTLDNGDVVTQATGRNLLGGPKAGFVIAVGNFSYTFDEEGNLIQALAGEGQLINVCELLKDGWSTSANSCHRGVLGPAKRSPAPSLKIPRKVSSAHWSVSLLSWE